MLRRGEVVFISFFLFFSMAFSDTKSEENKYFENMITIKVGRYLKQEFYEVRSDLSGGIYIDIRDFLEFTELTEYTNFTTDGKNINLSMKGCLFSDKKEKNIKIDKKELNILEFEGKTYIEKEDLAKLLPLKSIKWIEERYTLEISPSFNLPIEYRLSVKRRKKMLEGEKNKNKSTQKIDMFMKEDRKIFNLGMLKMRYDINDIGDFFKNGDARNRGDVEIEYSSQLFYGDFNMRQNLYSTGKMEEISLKYPYIFKGKTITIGDNYITGNDILGYDNKIRGISISENSYSIKRSGRDITIRGEAPKNSTVEIYQNGKVADYQRIDGNSYEFTIEMRNQSDKFKIKIYDRNGVLTEEKNINIMEGNNFLTKGKWDYNLFYGKNPNGKNDAYDDMKYDISYGITNNLTYAFDYYDTKNEKKLYRYGKHRIGYRFSNLPVPLLTNFSYYDSFEDASKGYIAEVRTKLFSYKLYYTYERYSDILATDEKKDSYHEAEISRDYGKFDYFIRFMKKYYMEKTEEKYEIGLSYDITKDLKVDLDFGKILKNGKRRNSNYTKEVGVDYDRGDYTYSLGVGCNDSSDAKWKYKGRMRKRMGKDSKYSYKIEVEYNKKNFFTFGVGFEYKFNDFFKMDYNYDSEKTNKHSVGGSFEKVVNLKTPLALNKSKDPDNGYVEGVIFIDKNGNGKKEVDEIPLEGIGVEISRNKIKTNEKGEFHLSNISPYRNNKLICNYSETIIDPTLKVEDLKEIELIPATGKKIEIGVVPVSIIMGSIILPNIDRKKINRFFSYVEIKVEKDGIYYDSIFPEYDGLFVIQDLKPGKYSLKINYLGNKKIILEKDTLEVVIKSGEIGDFYDGVDFKVSEIKDKKLKTVFYDSNF